MGQEATQSMGAPHSDDREAYLPTDDVQDAESPKSRSSKQREDGEGDDGFDLLKPGAEPIDETPEKMPRANPTQNIEQPDEDSDSDSVKHPDQETSSQVEVNKHVVSTQVPRMKVLDSNPSFKTMVSVPCNIETSPPKFEKSNMYTSLDGETREDLWKVLPKENPGTGKVLTTPTRRKGLNNFSGTTTARAPARSTPSTPEQMRLARSYEASPNLYLNLNGNPGEQWKQPSENPGQGKATATTPRRKPSSNMNSSSASGRGAPHSGASTPDQQQERLARSYAENPIEKYTGGRSRRREDQPSRVFSTTQSPRSSINSHRSRSPVPNHWQDHHQNNMMSSGSGATMGSDFDPMARSPRYITPTIAASLKAVKAPVKSIQFPSTTFGTTTLDRDPVRRGPNARDMQLRQSKEDSSSTGKGYPSLKVRTAPTPTQASSFTFRCEERAERRREYYTQLEERVKQKEAERKQMEARTLEEKESQLRELRKSLTYKANPVPRFYQEPVPPPPEIRKPPPTRAKSPNFTPSRRRDSLSFGDQHHVPMAPTPPPTPTPIAIPIPHSSARSSNRRLTIDTNILSYHEKVAQSSSQSKVKQAAAAGVDQQSTRRVSSIKKPNHVQKADLAPLRKSVTRDRSNGREITREKHSHQQQQQQQQQQESMEGPIKAFPRAEASEYFDDFEAMQRYLEEEEMMNANARSRTVSENGIIDADGVGEYGKYIVQHELLSPGSHHGSEKGKVWSPEELAKMHLRRNSPNQSANYASVKDIVLEFSRRLGTSSSSSPP